MTNYISEWNMFQFYFFQVMTSLWQGLAGELVNVLKEAGQVVPPALLKFGTHVKKKVLYFTLLFFHCGMYPCIRLHSSLWLMVYLLSSCLPMLLQESKLYGAHFKEIAADAPKAKKITFDDSDDEN